MRQLLYVSNTKRDFPASELAEIVAASRKNNAERDITGVLLYADGGFLQILEGEPQAVGELYTKIARDIRHWNTAILLDRQAERAFSNWSMGYKKVTESDGAPFQIAKEATINHRLPVDISVMLRTFLTVQGQV